MEYERHQGAYYKATNFKATNWINVDRTTGRGKKSTSHEGLIPAKDIWLYPLRKNFAAALCQQGLRVHRIFTKPTGSIILEQENSCSYVEMAARGFSVVCPLIIGNELLASAVMTHF